MTDPRLLREGTPRTFDRALLESARDDRAPDGSEDRALAALGIGVAIAGAVVVASQGASAPPAAAAVSKIATAVFLKWIGVGLAVTMATAVPVTYLVVTSAKTEVVAPTAVPSTARTPVATPAGDAPAIPAGSLPAAAEPSADAPVALPAPAPPTTTSRAASATSPVAIAPAPARSADSLSPELDVLDRVRAALAAHDPATARQALDEYDRRFPRGSLREEAELASIETLVASGNTAGAHEAALRFLAAHPSSTFGGRVRAIVKRTSNP
jgi:hypothetical protein